MGKMYCKCPHILCSVHGNCRKCIEKNIEEKSVCYCMEHNAELLGAKLPGKFPVTEIYDSEKDMSRRCAELVKETLEKKPDALLCFPAGMTVVKTCEILKEMQDKGEIDFSKAKFVSLDEWLDLEDESENCTHFLHKHLYGPLGIKEEQMTLFDVHATDLEAECKRIDQFIFDNGHIDLMLLGMGMNGHLGLNEPGDNFEDYAKVVQLSETTMQVGQKYFSDGMKLTRGITLGIHHIFETKKVILQICGKHKAEAVNKLYQTRPTMDFPASALKLMEDARIILDYDAAAGILK